jgi:L-amino acid N-acyltransferase YncA
MDIIIHKVLPEDAYDYTVCHIACWQSAYKDIIPSGFLANMPNEIEQRTERLKNNLNESTDISYYYAAVNGKMIGRLIFGKCRDEDKSNAGEVTAVYLIKEYWNKGLGRKMMDYAIDELKSIGYDEIIVWVLEDNNRARRFYEKYGFTLDGAKKEMQMGKSLTVVRYTMNL